LNKQALVHRSQLLDQIPRSTPGIYTLSGGQQTGKTTLLKQWMAELLKSRVPANSIAYMTGELINDHHSLVRLVTGLLTEMPAQDLKFIILDEVTYIRDWDKGVKYLADAGMLESTVLMITGSDMVIIKEARMRFPGRRGISEKLAGFVADQFQQPMLFEIGQSPVVENDGRSDRKRNFGNEGRASV